jgi:hypothetical protein
MPKTRIYKFFVLAALFGLLLPLTTYGWYEKIHSYLVKIAAEIVGKIDGAAGPSDDKKGLYQELTLSEALVQMGRGAWREDYAPPVDGNSRAFRHYYDPDARRPIKGVAYFSHYRLWPHLEAGSEVTEPRGGFYEGAMRWALNGGGAADNPFHWQGAIRAYGAGTVEGKREAYLRLGHVLHLLGDMSEPDHATNTPHPGSGKHLPGELEEFVADKIADLVLAIRRKARLAGADDVADLAAALVQAELRESARDYIKADFESRYGGKRVQLIGLEGLLEDGLDPRLVQEFFLERERVAVPRRVDGLPALALGEGARPRRHLTFQEYFDTLARSAKDRTVRSRFSLPVGCAHLGPLLIRFVHEGVREQALGWAGFENAVAWVNPDFADWAKRDLLPALMPDVLKEPLYFLPTIDELDESSSRPYTDFGEALLRETVGSVAGLMTHFHDIVNEPPFVQEVRVTQSGERYYRGIWLDRATISVPTGRTEEDYRGVRNSDVPGSYREIRERVLDREPDTSFLHVPKELLSGQGARLEIVFGPVLKWRDAEITERIAPDSVKVSVDGKPVTGRMTGPNTWRGDFVPKLGGGERARYFPIEIEARDLNAHYPRTDLPSGRYDLDSRPGDSSWVLPQEPDYPLRGYTPGPDKNHAVFIAPSQATEPPVKPSPVIVPPVNRGWEGEWSCESLHTKGSATGRSFRWTFSVVRTGEAYVVVTQNGRFSAQVTDHALKWKGQGGGNIIDIELTLDPDGRKFKGRFNGGHYSNGKMTEAIEGTYSGSRIR